MKLLLRLILFSIIMGVVLMLSGLAYVLHIYQSLGTFADKKIIVIDRKSVV